MYSVAEENYIKGIYHLQQKARSVSTNALAKHMNTKAASVTDMLKKLQTKKLLDYEPYYGVRLSSSGIKLALSIVRRHRLWEYFLVNSIGFGWEEVHEIAEQLEHVQHPALIEKLDIFLGRPAFDPHGDPIPDIDGKMANVHYVSLTEVEPGKQVVFAAVGLQTADLMNMLQHKGLKLGDKLKVAERFDFDQSLEVLINNKKKATLSFKLGRMILVKKPEV